MSTQCRVILFPSRLRGQEEPQKFKSVLLLLSLCHKYARWTFFLQQLFCIRALFLSKLFILKYFLILGTEKESNLFLTPPQPTIISRYKIGQIFLLPDPNLEICGYFLIFAQINYFFLNNCFAYILLSLCRTFYPEGALKFIFFEKKNIFLLFFCYFPSIYLLHSVRISRKLYIFFASDEKIIDFTSMKQKKKRKNYCQKTLNEKNVSFRC